MMRGFKREWYYKRTKLSSENLNIKAMIEFNLEVDASGLNCPLPLLRLKKALMGMATGDVVKVIATDPAAHLDFGVYSDQSGHQIIQLIRESDKQIFYFKKK
jgi:tRNA 2-thiouridine synthesizing protein A